MTCRFNDRLNVAYKRTSQGVFCSDCSENWGWGIFIRNSGEFSSGIDRAGADPSFAGIWRDMTVVGLIGLAHSPPK